MNQIPEDEFKEDVRKFAVFALMLAKSWDVDVKKLIEIERLQAVCDTDESQYRHDVETFKKKWRT